MAIGAAFITFRGSNVLSRFYEQAGTPDLAFRIEETVRANGTLIAVLLGVAIASGTFLLWRRTRRLNWSQVGRSRL